MVIRRILNSDSIGDKIMNLEMRKDLQDTFLVPFFYDKEQNDNHVEYLDSVEVAACTLVQTADDALLDFNYGMVAVNHPKHGLGYILRTDLEDL